MVTCRYYQYGCCKFSDACKFIHTSEVSYQCEWCKKGHCRDDDRCVFNPPHAVKLLEPCKDYYSRGCDYLDVYCQYQHRQFYDFKNRLLCSDRKDCGQKFYSHDGIRFYQSQTGIKHWVSTVNVKGFSMVLSDYMMRYDFLPAKKTFDDYRRTYDIICLVSNFDVMEDLKTAIINALYRLIK